MKNELNYYLKEFKSLAFTNMDQQSLFFLLFFKNILFQILQGLAYMHKYGFFHRDLKPENILMTDNTDDADIRLLDFGLSKIIGPNEFCNEPFGTLVI